MKKQGKEQGQDMVGKKITAGPGLVDKNPHIK